MGSSDNGKLYELVELVRSWMPVRLESAKMSRDFWMPDSSCMVCYECDSQFTIFNRKHHCRLCGRVFCARCTTNSVLSPSDESTSRWGEGDRIRACNFCLNQRRQQSATGNNVMVESSPGLSLSPSSSSLASTQSSCCTCNSGSSASSAGYTTGSFHHVSCADGQSIFRSVDSIQMDSSVANKDQVRSPTKLDYLDGLGEPYGSCSRSDDEDDDYSMCRSHSETAPESPFNLGYGTNDFYQVDDVCEPGELQSMEERTHPTSASILSSENYDEKGLDCTNDSRKQDDGQSNNFQSENDPNGVDFEGVEYEKHNPIWLPPEPEVEEDEREGLASEDDEGCENELGEWGYLRSSSFVDGESRSRDRSNEEHRRAMKRVVDEHFRSLITQLLLAENLPATEHDSWLDIITKLSWEATTLIKPDTSEWGGMDPGGYVKVKCVACGHRSESVVIKGVVCKKNVAHRRMTSKIDKARILLLGGALEYQRVASHLSSFDTLLQQEKDHLKMAVAKIDAHHPNILLVEKSVSRYAQDYLLAKNISLVLNIKRPLLERIARCTGAQIVPSIDNLSAPKLGYCDSFHVERLLENLGSAGQGGKKLSKTLMFFEGCPRPLGCTILLKGASGDELKRVKHVMNYGVFAAYHLALETSFLADEGAAFPELPLKSPINVALPESPSRTGSSISMTSGSFAPSLGKPQENQHSTNSFQDKNNQYLDVDEPPTVSPSRPESFLTERSFSWTSNAEPVTHDMDFHYPQENGGPGLSTCEVERNDGSDYNTSLEAQVSRRGFCFPNSEGNRMPSSSNNSELSHLRQHNINRPAESGILKEELSHSSSNHQSILVSLSTRCVWNGSVCERAHIFRIKYYGNFDKPLGRFLRGHLFDQDYRCHSCEMPSEAHVHCYTHRLGSLTISLKKLQDFKLPGEREGKIWMWHRCLRCPRIDGFPPATKRVVMSNAAWGLSFGKFLELSFSNHAAASRVASCGHSLHRDCLRFYGCGKMVACFRYAPINVHSVYLPPPMLEFDYHNQEWIQKEFDEVHQKADLLFAEVLKALNQISQKVGDPNMKEAVLFFQQISELQLMIQIEKKEFEESLRYSSKWATKSGHPEIDILEINKLKRQLIFQAYVWDQRLVHVYKSKDKDVVSRSSRGFSSWDSSLLSLKSDSVLTDIDQFHVNTPNEIRKGTCTNIPDTDSRHSSPTNFANQPEIQPLEKTVRRARSEGQFPVMENASEILEPGGTGSHTEIISPKDRIVASPSLPPRHLSPGIVSTTVERVSGSSQASYDVENPMNWVKIPFSVIYDSFEMNSTKEFLKLGKVSEYTPVYVSSFKQLLNLGGARLLLPMASGDTIVPIYDDEPTSIISYALVSPHYKNLSSKDLEKPKSPLELSSSFSILDSINFFSLHSFDESSSESIKSLSSFDENILSSGSRSLSGLDPLQFPDILYTRIAFSDDGPPGKVNYTVTCYHAKQFEALRKTCNADERDFIRSLSRCKKWGAQGGKSNVFFAKTLDDRFIIKQVTKTELESFIKFAPSYFKYLTESINSGCPTCLAKILGIYQVQTKHLKGGKEWRMDVLVMENLLFRRSITRLYDLKGSSRSRYNPDSSGSNKVLLDQNLIESMPTSPIFLGTKAKRFLERAIWNDTSFLASIDVMDYSLLVGVDEEKHELVVGIIDFMRQYTWDKHLENWVKASGILGGPKNVAPTVISPKQYKKRFRKAMSAYFLMVPDQWPCSSIQPTTSQSNLCE